MGVRLCFGHSRQLLGTDAVYHVCVSKSNCLTISLRGDVDVRGCSVFSNRTARFLSQPRVDTRWLQGRRECSRVSAEGIESQHVSASVLNRHHPCIPVFKGPEYVFARPSHALTDSPRLQPKTGEKIPTISEHYRHNTRSTLPTAAAMLFLTIALTLALACGGGGGGGASPECLTPSTPARLTWMYSTIAIAVLLICFYNISVCTETKKSCTNLGCAENPDLTFIPNVSPDGQKPIGGSHSCRDRCLEMTLVVIGDTGGLRTNPSIDFPAMAQSFYGHQDERQAHSHLSDAHPWKRRGSGGIR